MIKLLAVCLLVGWAAAQHGKCTLDRNSTTTFDMKNYPSTLEDSCWYTALQNRPKRGSPMSNTSVFVKNFLGGKKEVKVTVKENIVIRMKPSSTSSQGVDVYMNGQLVEISPGQTIRLPAKPGMSTVKVIAGYTGEVLVKVSFHNLGIGYDGTRVIIDVDENYRDVLRGLCGTFDDNQSNDFKTQNNCVVSSAADFVSIWTLGDENCRSVVRDQAMNTNTRECPGDEASMNDLMEPQRPEPLIPVGKYLYLLSKNTACSLYATAAGNLYTLPHVVNINDPENQYWHTMEISPGYMLFQNSKLGTALYADDSGRLLTELVDCTKLRQHWKVIPASVSGYVYLQNRANKRVLDSGDKMACSASPTGFCSDAHAYARYMGTDYHHWQILV